MPQITSWLKNCPKVELHAHLFASITQKQLHNLLIKKNLIEDSKSFEDLSNKLDVDLIFQKAFSYLPKITRTLSDLSHILDLVIQNFIDDNVLYLEIRSTPKNLEDSDFKGYFQTIRNRIEAFKSRISVRYLVSVNRDVPVSEYLNLLEDIKSIHNYKSFILGLDFCGNPKKNSFKQYLPIFEEARKMGLKITLHAPEIPGANEDLDDILDFKPDRIGHFLYYDKNQFERLLELNIPVEICPTSNSVVKKGQIHNFTELLNKGLKKYTICTDDWLIFGKSLSEEIDLFRIESKMSKSDLKKMILQSVDFIFDESLKPNLRKYTLEYFENN